MRLAGLLTLLLAAWLLVVGLVGAAWVAYSWGAFG